MPCEVFGFILLVRWRHPGVAQVAGDPWLGVVLLTFSWVSIAWASREVGRVERVQGDDVMWVYGPLSGKVRRFVNL